MKLFCKQSRLGVISSSDKRVKMLEADVSPTNTWKPLVKHFISKNGRVIYHIKSIFHKI